MFPRSTRDVTPNTRALFSPRELTKSKTYVKPSTFVVHHKHDHRVKNATTRTDREDHNHFYGESEGAHCRSAQVTTARRAYQNPTEADTSMIARVDYGNGKEIFSGGKSIDQSKFYVGGSYHPTSFTMRAEQKRGRACPGFTPSRYRQSIRGRIWNTDETGNLVRSPQERHPNDLGVGDLQEFQIYSPRPPKSNTPPWEKKSKALAQANAKHRVTMRRTDSPRANKHLTTCVKTHDVEHSPRRSRSWKKNPPHQPQQWPFDMIQKPTGTKITGVDGSTAHLVAPPTWDEDNPIITSRNIPPTVGGQRVHDGTFCRDPSAENLFDLDGDGDIDDEDIANEKKIGKFLHIKDPDLRMAARVHEGRRVVVQNLLLEGYRRHLIDLDFNMYAGKHIEEIVEMIASRDDFDDYMNYIKKYYHSNPMENNDVYVDIDGDGNIDAEDIYITSKIGLFEEITDPKKRHALQVFEGKYIMVLFMVNEFRDVMWHFDPKYRKMSQKEIVMDIVNDPLFHDKMDEFNRKRRMFSTTGSKQVIKTMGGSKDWMPVKAQMTARSDKMLKTACMDHAYNKIVDHEGAFLKKHQGYSNMTGWLHQLKQCTGAMDKLDAQLKKKQMF